MSRGAPDEIILRKHRLPHLRELRVGRDLLDGRFAAGCSMSNCNARCCRGGVFADLGERDIILEHAGLIRAQMDSSQVRDERLWFEEETVEDADYPSGRSVGTEVHDGKCVFLDGAGACVLQKAAAAAGMPRHAIKPFFCWIYPVTIDGGELALHDAEYAERPSCCGHAQTGELTVFDVCREELGLVLGEEGYRELRRLALPEDPRGE